MTSTNNSFGKEKHLKSRKQIDQLFTSGKAFFVHPIKVFWRLEEHVDEVRTTDAGLPATDGIQFEMQATKDGLPVTDEIQLADDIRKQTSDSQNIAEESPKSIIENQSSPISRLSSVVSNRSSVVGRPSSAVSIGVSASKRNFKKAVDRNRVKRLLREAYRLSQHDLQQAMTGKNASLQVFFIFVDKTIPTFALVQEKMLICLKRLQKIAGEAKNEKLL